MKSNIIKLMEAHDRVMRGFKEAEGVVEGVIALAPSGSGFDSKPTFNFHPKGEKLVIRVPFHPMNSEGYYTAWKYGTVTVKPTWSGISIDVKGFGNDLNDYIAEVYYDFLMGESHV